LLDNPLSLYYYTQRTACDKGYKFARHQYFTLDIQKFHMTLTFCVANLKKKKLKIPVSIFLPRQGNAISDLVLEE
jgi:hypothetical protein